MFISKLEKEQINDWILGLQMKVDALTTDMLMANAKLKVLMDRREVIKPKKTQRTAEQKRKQAEYMKAWHAKNREKKLAAV